MQIDPYSTFTDSMLPPRSAGAHRAAGFEDLLRNSVSDVNTLQLNVEDLIQRSAAGEEIPQSVVANAVVKSDLAFRTMLQIRNKLVEAFTELRQMQI